MKTVFFIKGDNMRLQFTKCVSFSDAWIQTDSHVHAHIPKLTKTNILHMCLHLDHCHSIY